MIDELGIRACRACGLCELGNGPVPPSFPATGASSVLVLGEAPGRVENRLLQPFQGPAGALARSWLSEAHLDPATVTWANVCCCWPARRDPQPTDTEMEACRPNLLATIARARPRYILAFGNVAMRALGIERRGEWREFDYADYARAYCYGTYHPSAVLRNRSLESQTRKDIHLFSLVARDTLAPLGVDMHAWDHNEDELGRRDVRVPQQFEEAEEELVEEFLQQSSSRPGTVYCVRARGVDKSGKAYTRVRLFASKTSVRQWVESYSKYAAQKNVTIEVFEGSVAWAKKPSQVDAVDA